MALVPITEADMKNQRKHNRELLKMKARMSSATGRHRKGNKSNRVFYDADNANND